MGTQINPTLAFAGQVTRELSADRTSALRQADKDIRAFVEIFAMDDSANKTNGALYDLTFGVKEVFEQRSRRSPWGVDFFQDRLGTETAFCISSLEQAGARRIGTTRSTLLAITGDSGTRNPMDLTRTPGGSSAGSAAAVAAGFVDFALGSQTVGSIIRPASYCGVPGFKPSFGTISNEGVMPLASELDHVGVLARDISTLRRTMQVLGPLAPAAQELDTVLVPDFWFEDDVHPAVAHMIEIARLAFGKAGVRTEKWPIPDQIRRSEKDLLNALLVKGIHDNHGPFIKKNATRLPAELIEFDRRGQMISHAQHADARAQQEEMALNMTAIVGERAAVLSPSVCDMPPLLGQGTGSRAPQRLWTLLGWPALGIPFDSYDGDAGHLSVSVQLTSKAGNDAALLDLDCVLTDCLKA